MIRRIGKSFRAAFGMFTALPMGRVDWEEDSLSLMFCFFPLVGVLLGLLNLYLAYLGEYFLFGDVFMGIILTLSPVLCTGGIHLDGFMDVEDALSSWKEREDRLRILSDAHVGAFAVIRLACLLLLMVGAFSDMWMEEKGMYIMSLVFILSRVLSALGVLYLPKAKKEGSLAYFAEKSKEKVVGPVLFVYLAILAMGMTFLSPILGGAALITGFLLFLWYRYISLKYFGGITGDLNGYFLCICEAGCAITLAVLSRLF
ncbi:MAG: adenosylcobinamide-GDP ribazoletransferase [Blautia sp.]|nr:adenosylcobinamide-GDP ribazoletransferase [Blautia sp.]